MRKDSDEGEDYLPQAMGPIPKQPSLFDTCHKCRAPLVWKIAEASEKGLRRELWRCTRCEGLTLTGWRPPSWGNEIARICHALSVGIADAVEAAYTLPDGDSCDGRS